MEGLNTVVKTYAKSFIPLESNPVPLNALMHGLGVSSAFELVDIWSFDESELSMLPRPALALILVLPTSDEYERRRTAGKDSIAKELQKARLIWIQQTIDNACGLYAILHAVCIPQMRDYIGMVDECFCYAHI